MSEIKNTDIKQVYFSSNLKDQAHKYFDQLWLFKYCTRSEAYQYLAERLGVEEPKAHMSLMNKDQCKEVIEWAIMLLNDFRRLDLDWGDKINHPYYELIKPKMKTNGIFNN